MILQFFLGGKILLFFLGELVMNFACKSCSVSGKMPASAEEVLKAWLPF